LRTIESVASSLISTSEPTCDIADCTAAKLPKSLANWMVSWVDSVHAMNLSIVSSPKLPLNSNRHQAAQDVHLIRGTNGGLDASCFVLFCLILSSVELAYAAGFWRDSLRRSEALKGHGGCEVSYFSAPCSSDLPARPRRQNKD
jgi:hypothetical protein